MNKIIKIYLACLIFGLLLLIEAIGEGVYCNAFDFEQHTEQIYQTNDF